MKEMFLYGINGWSTYYKDGTAAVFIALAIVYLGHLFFVRRKNGELTPLRLLLHAVIVMFVAFVCPVISNFFGLVAPEQDGLKLFFLLPTAVIFGMVGVELFHMIETGEYGRFAKQGFFLGVIAIFVVTLMSPFLIHGNRFSIAKNVDRVNADVVEIAETVGYERVLLPKRYAASMGEYSSDVSFVSMADVGADESDLTSMAMVGLENHVDYMVVDKTQLSSDLLGTMDAAFEYVDYTPVTSGKKYALYKLNDYWEVVQHDDESGKQAIFYTLYNPKTKALVVVDGGWTENADHVREVIESYGGEVTAWILTHYHADHIGAFNEIYKNPGDIAIYDIYVSAYDKAYDEFLVTHESYDDPATFATYMEQTDGGSAINIHHPKRGEELEIDGLKLKFYNTYDEKLNELGAYDLPNNAGLIFRASFGDRSMLFMGDAYYPVIADWMIGTYGDEIKSNYISCAHHGNSILPASFYEQVLINPGPDYYGNVLLNGGIMFFDAPRWLMESDEHKAKELASWVDSVMYLNRVDYEGCPHKFYFW